MLDPEGLTIHIDGSAYGNPGHEGGIAAVVEFPEHTEKELQIIFQLGFSETTNNRMELAACVKALEWARKNWRTFEATSVIILTDSRYVCENLARAAYWKKNKWRNNEGRPIENHDLWNALLSAKNKVGIRTEINWEKGKLSTIAKIVDKSAKGAARGIIKTKDPGFRAGKISRTKAPDGSACMFHANGQEATIGIYRKTLKIQGGKSEYQIRFDLQDNGTEKFILKQFAYTSTEIEKTLHRGHVYRVRFNNNPKYPVIEEILGEVVGD